MVGFGATLQGLLVLKSHQIVLVAFLHIYLFFGKIDVFKGFFICVETIFSEIGSM